MMLCSLSMGPPEKAGNWQGAIPGEGLRGEESEFFAFSSIWVCVCVFLEGSPPFGWFQGKKTRRPTMLGVPNFETNPFLPEKS